MYSSFNPISTDIKPEYQGEDIPQYITEENVHRKWSKSMNIIALVVLVVTMGLVMYVGVSNSPRNYASLYRTSSSFDMKIKGSDPKYGSTSSISSSSPWDAIIEPHKPQTLSIESFSLGDKMIDMEDSSYAYVWKVADTEYYGSVVDVTVTTTGVVDITVTVTNGIGPTKPTTKTFKVAVKYIRREIRTLSDDDRTTFFNALQTLYTTSTSDGQALYGSKYKSAEDFLYTHLNGAGRVDCDHWHDGAGIVNHHVAISLQMEQALQSIDPTISLPYWEYGQDSMLYDNWYESPIFNDDWFGIANPGTDDHTLQSGRWSGLKLPDGSSYADGWDIAATSSLNPFVNARGHMRAPWNNNPSQGVSRCNTTYEAHQTTMPSCTEMSACYLSSSLSDMTNCLNGVTHGPVHILIGGTWNSEGQDDITLLKSIDRVLLFKLLWRTGYTRCPSSCEDGETCSCAVPQEYIDTYGIQTILENGQVYDLIKDKMPLDDEVGLTNAIKALQDPGIAGEMFSSAASYDPSFWPLHGQVERILGLKRIQLYDGIISSSDFDETWGFSVTDERYLQGTCDWSAISSVDDMTLPTCDFSSSASCSGHDEDDVLEFSGFISDDDTYTNAEFYTFIHPYNDDLPYVYDTYTFDYCTDEGYVFE